MMEVPTIPDLQEDPISYHVLKRYLKHDSRGESGYSRCWRISPELPTAEEIMAAHPPPLPEPGLELSPSKSEYLEAQYWLNRFEGTELLRRAVNHFREIPQQLEEDFYIYSQVHVQGYLFAKSGAACRISFSTERSPTKVAWNQSTRLTAGTLVALSPCSDNFKTKCFVAVVAARYLRGGVEPDPEQNEDENTPPRIEIFWENFDDATLDPSIELVMLEAKGGYFEQVRHAMIGLQHAAQYDSKFDKYIIDGDRRHRKAEYLEHALVHTPTDAAKFDFSQDEAFRRMTSTELPIVQGPPGTGKTFTSTIAIQSYIQTLRGMFNKQAPPVVIAAQTNHALDQLLGKCMQDGANVVRLGGRTQNVDIDERTIFNLSKSSKVRGGSKGEADRKAILSRLEKSLETYFPEDLISAETFFAEGLLSQDQLDSLRDPDWETEGAQNDGSFDLMEGWLRGHLEEDRTYIYRPPRGQSEPEGGQDTQERSPEEEERERLQGKFISAEFRKTGSVPSDSVNKAAWYWKGKKVLEGRPDLNLIRENRRGMVYRYLRAHLIEKFTEKEFPALLKKYQEACNKITVGRWSRYVQIIRNEGAEVLGCTTTGLSKYRGLISALKPRVLLIEEAAETREANITSALYPSLDQLVLVGDHQQLVPHVDVRELADDPHYLSKSLFERLVCSGSPYSMLKVQRRMIPIIRSVVHTFYPELEDHVSVKDRANRPPVPGMGGRNLWWFEHQWPDSRNANLSSYNPKEAGMIVGFVRYLLQNGLRPSQVTILTYYKGQVDIILKQLKNDSILAGFNPSQEWSVRTVDGFQGEENDVILLSLVRSPSNPHDMARVGFVEDEHRAVVATSRARCGMYVFGNSNNILGDFKSNETWKKVYDVFVKERCLGYNMPVVCQNHNNITILRQPEDWNKVRLGGCHEPCDENCPRGHPCKMTCHAKQSRFRCTEQCTKVLPCGHICGAKCGDNCDCSKGCNKPALADAKSFPLPHRQAAGESFKHKNMRVGAAGRKGNDQGSMNPRAQHGRRDQGARSRHPPLLKHESFGTQTSTISQGVTEPSSEDLMEQGYHALVTNERGTRSRIHSPTTTSLGFESIPPSEGSLSSKWSPEAIRAGDEALRLRRLNQGSPTPLPMRIRSTFWCTAASGSSQAEMMEYTIPAPQSQLDAREVNGDASRKCMLLDSAAGFHTNQGWESEMDRPVHEAAKCEADLIQFD